MTSQLPPFFDGEELLRETKGSIAQGLLLGLFYVLAMLLIAWGIGFLFPSDQPFPIVHISVMGAFFALVILFQQPDYVAVTTRRLYLKYRSGRKFSVLFPEIQSIRKAWGGIEITSSRLSRKLRIRTVPKSDELLSLIQRELAK
ncbi:hypothetical protein TRP8649_00026 [Pelagimonas phthalicica]|uniref:Uncharacterized protein n=1 Tax=Pelagimonas phthalicica TaxID=1037362 RepID=A0A238J6U0_9RHOB|nr:hypothetical protein [Pelagimonas phthalicica]TDS95523.1 hypothetical protein CLV87_2047 [Pelagimonas phthalicica]SMX25954.1 hypothetical protein TRP8649_00026 [Pelagimonas phthalicica]